MVRIALAVASCLSAGALVACGGSSSGPAAPEDGGAAAAAADASIAADAGEAEIETAIRASCSVAAPTDCPAPAPRYADIVPILKAVCIQCHDGATDASQWPLTTYEHVADWADVIRDELTTCAMPPIDGGVPISAADRLSILRWVRCGALE